MAIKVSLILIKCTQNIAGRKTEEPLVLSRVDYELRGGMDSAHLPPAKLRYFHQKLAKTKLFNIFSVF